MLLTEQEAAAYAKVCTRTIRDLIKTGRLRAIDYGKGSRHCYRIDPEDLKAIEPVTPTAAPGRRLRPRQKPAAGLWVFRRATCPC